MANAWSELSWGQGNFGSQNNITVPVTSAVDNPIAWNQSIFGNGNWGGKFNDISLTLGDETTAGEINEGWGRLTWGENAWGGTGDVILEGLQLNLSLGEESIKIDTSPIPDGLQLNTTLNSINLNIATEVFLSENPLQTLTVSQGEVDPSPDAIVTGEQINITTGNVIPYNREGWGRYYWGEEEWGDSGLWEEVQLTNTNLGLTIDSGIREYWGENSWGSSNTEWGGTYITETDISVIVQPQTIAPVGWGVVGWGEQGWNASEVNIAMTIAEGEVDPSPDANVTGIGMTVSLAVGTVVAGDANTSVTGEQINISQGNAEGIPNTIASITGIGLNISLGTVFAGATAEVDVTGNGLTVSLNNINNQIWTEINTGTVATWIEIDTAA